MRSTNAPEHEEVLMKMRDAKIPYKLFSSYSNKFQNALNHDIFDASIIAYVLRHFTKWTIGGALRPETIQFNSIFCLDFSVADPYKISYLTLDRARQLAEKSPDAGFILRSASREEYERSILTSRSRYQHRTFGSYAEEKRVDKLVSHAGDYGGYDQVNSRYHSRPAKVMKKLFANMDILPEEYEQFANLWKTYCDTEYSKNFTINIVEGEDIRKYYHYSMHANEHHILGNSCMRHNHCQDYLNIYVDNPDRIKMAVMLNEEGLVLARALLWEAQHIKEKGERESIKLMDRIYANGDHREEILRNWGYDSGYAMYTGTGSFKVERSGVNVSNLFVPLKNTDYETYPYMDSFKKLDVGLGLYSAYATMGGADGYLESTEGGGRNGYGCTCDSCGVHMDEDEGHHVDGEMHCGDCAVYSEYYGESILRRYAIEVLTQYGNYDYVDGNDAVYSEYHGVEILESEASAYISEYGNTEYAFNDDLTYSTFSGDYILSEHAEETPDGEDYIYSNQLEDWREENEIEEETNETV